MPALSQNCGSIAASDNSRMAAPTPSSRATGRACPAKASRRPGTFSRTSNMKARTIGTSTRNAARQPSVWVRNPPRIGPPVEPAAQITASMPKTAGISAAGKTSGMSM